MRMTSCLRVVAIACALFSMPASAQDRTVFLTIDDGPLSGMSNILRALEAEKVPATLFLVGEHVQASKEHKDLLAKAKASPFVTIGNHSYSHAHNRYRSFYSNAAGVLEDLEEANKVLGLTVAPFHTRLPGRDVFRLPGVTREDRGIGHAEDELEKADYDKVAAAGFYLYGWDHEWSHDSRGKPVQSVEQLVSEIGTKFARRELVTTDKMLLLMHDEMFSDRYDGYAKFRALIAALKAKGYAFGHLKDYHR